MDIYNLISFAGIFILLGFTWLLSADRRNMNWRVIIWGIERAGAEQDGYYCKGRL